MDLYHGVLFFHIMGAVILVSMGFIMPVMTGALHRTPTVAGMREWVTAMQKYTRLGPPAAIVVLLSGLFMTWDAYSFSDGWIVVSLVLFVMAGGIAGGILEPHLKKVLGAAEATPDGPVPAELRAVAADSRAENFESLMLGFDFAIVFMMTNKPGWTGALIAMAVGLAIAGALIARRSRAGATAHAV